MSEDEYECRIDALRVLSGQSWSIYKVTRLLDIEFSSAKLERYSQKIKEKLVSDSMASKLVKVSIMPQKDLKLAIENPDALQINIFTKSMDAEEFKVACECILMSWGVEEVSPKYTSLPLMFARGNKSILICVKRSLNLLFGCFFTDINFTNKDLISISSMLVKTIPMQHEQNVDLVYHLSNAQTKGNLIISNRVIDLHRLARGLNDIRTEELGEEGDDDMYFYCCLQNMIMDKFELDLTMLNLVEVKYPGITVRSNGLANCSDPVLLSHFLDTLMRNIL